MTAQIEWAPLSHLFKVNHVNPNYLSVTNAEAFYHSIMQLAYLAHCARLDIGIAITFLQTMVQCPNHNDFKKLLWVIKYLQRTRGLELTLSIDPTKNLPSAQGSVRITVRHCMLES